MYNKYKQRFAIKKFTIGVASVFIGGTALMATDVLPFNIVNVASASEDTTSGVISKGIEYKLVNNNKKDYYLNDKSENALLSIKGINEQAEADSLSIVIEKTAPVEVSMSSPDPSIKSETIGNTTRMKLGSFTEGSYYSIPIFTKYKYGTDNGTINDLTVKVVNDVTGEVLYSDTIHQVNKASEITEITLDETIEMRGKFNVPENKVVESPLGYSASTAGDYLYHKSMYRLSDTSLPQGGDKIKTTIISGGDNFEISHNNIHFKETFNKDNKLTEPLVVKYEVVNSRGEKKGIEKTVTYNFSYEDVYDFTTWEEVEKSEKIHFSPTHKLQGESKIIDNEEVREVNVPDDAYSYFDSISYGLGEALYIETEKTNTPNVNYIRYAHKEYNPKEFKIKFLENNITKPLFYKFYFDIENAKIASKNLEKGKIWIKKSNGEKEYIYGDDTIYDLLNNYKKYSKNVDYSFATSNGLITNLYNSSDFNEYFEKYHGVDLKTGMYTKMRNMIIKIRDIADVKEIGIDFPEDTKITTTKEIEYMGENKQDSELEKLSLAKNLIEVEIGIVDEPENISGTLIKTTSSLSFHDSDVEMNTINTTLNNKAIEKWKPGYFSINNDKVNAHITDIMSPYHNRVDKKVYKILTDKKIRMLSKNVTGITNKLTDVTVETINGEEYTVIDTGEYNKEQDSGRDIDGYYSLSNMTEFIFHNNSDMYKLNKNERGEIEFPDIEFLLQIPKEIMEYVEIPEQWIKVEELSIGEYNTYRHYKNLKYKVLPAEGFILKDVIKNDNLKSIVNKNDILDMKTEIYNNQTSSVSNLSVVKVVPKIGNLALNGDKVTDSLDTDFVELSGDTDGWDIYYSTTVRQQGENVSTITDWTQEVPEDKSTITHVKWVKRDNLSGGNGATLGFKVKAKELNNTEENGVRINSYSYGTEYILNSISGFNLGNNSTYGGSITSKIKIEVPEYKEYNNYFIDINNNKIQDEDEDSIKVGAGYYREIDIQNALYNIYDSSNNTTNKLFTKKLSKYNIIEVGRSLNQPDSVNSTIGFEPEMPVTNYYIKVEDAHPLLYKYYDIKTGEVVKEVSINIKTTEESIDNIPVFLSTTIKDKNQNEWKVDLETEHTHPKTKELYVGSSTYEKERDTDLLSLSGGYEPYYGQPLEYYIPVSREKSGKIDVVLVDKATGEPLKVTNIVTEDSKPAGERVTIEESDAPEYITIGDKTYKKVEKPNLPTEAVVPGATDNADVEFEYEVVRGAVYGVFKAENGNNIIKDRVTIIEGGQPEDTTREYTAPSRITDDNGKVWELVSPVESVTYTNGENATEHILTYREVKKNVALKYVTNTGETIKEELLFENKSVGSKYRINTPETITKDAIVYNVSGEREVTGRVEDNDNIITIEVSPKPKQVAIIKFVDNNGEELSEIERKRVEGYDGTNINVTLENIPNYRIINNPFETTQVFDTDNNVDQEFSVVLERIPATAIPFETEYVADETREYGSENITEREGVEGAREDNGEVSRQPVNKIVKVATGSKVERKETPFNVIYEADENKVFGDNSTTNGKNKVEEITTTYTLDTTGVVIPSTPTTVLIEAGSPETHTFGTKSTITTEDIPFTTEYVGDNTVDYGTENVNTEGTTGVRTTTITYRLDDDSHTVIANEPIVNITKQPTSKVITKGTKPTETVISETAFTTITKEDSTLNKGEEVVEVEGVNGKTVNITEYTVNRETGEVTSTTREEVREAVNKVVRVGTKETSTNIETDTLTADEEKAKEDKHSDAWEETANEYNKQKETDDAKDNSTQDKQETVNNENSKESNREVTVENKTVQDAEVQAKELPETNTNNSLLYTATALIGLATLLRRKKQ